MSSTSKGLRYGPWLAAGTVFLAWQLYDQKHPQEFSKDEQNKWNERVKRENMLGSKRTSAGPTITSAGASSSNGERR